MTRCAAVLLMIWAGSSSAADPDPKSLAIPPDTRARAADLVGLLASRDYAERVDATRELRALGRSGLPTLREALASVSNPEVRLRVEMLLPAAVADDLHARLECFLADTDGKHQHELPGGTAYFAAAGRTDAAKKLFADMIRSPNRDMLAAADAPEADLRRKFDERRAALNLTPGARSGVAAVVTDVDVAAILFIDSLLPDLGPSAGVIGVAAGGRLRAAPVVSNSQFQSALVAALEADDRSGAVAGVVRRWMETREHAQSAYSAVTAMTRAALPNALPAARNLITGKVTGGPVTYRNQAIAYLARFGSADDLPVLEKLFADRSTLVTAVAGGPASRRRTILTRDLALAMALLLSKQDPTEFGFDFRYAFNSYVSDTQKYNASAYYFDADTDEKADVMREAALKKYREWKDGQKKAKK